MTPHDHLSEWVNSAPYDTFATRIPEAERLVAQEEDKNITVYPPKEHRFDALRYCGPSQTKVIIIGQDPYHTPGKANGLAFSTPPNTSMPPSLSNIFTELNNDLGIRRTNPQLHDWAAQGILLLNTALTVRAGDAYSHVNMGWAPAVADLMATALLTRLLDNKPIVIVCWGRAAMTMREETFAHARELADLTLLFGQFTPDQITRILPQNIHEGHPLIKVLASSHPSPYSANKGCNGKPAFMGSKPFSQINQFLMERGEHGIQW